MKCVKNFISWYIEVKIRNIKKHIDLNLGTEIIAIFAKRFRETYCCIREPSRYKALYKITSLRLILPKLAVDMVACENMGKLYVMPQYSDTFTSFPKCGHVHLMSGNNKDPNRVLRRLIWL